MYSDNLNDEIILLHFTHLYSYFMVCTLVCCTLSSREISIFYIRRKLQLDEMISNNDKNEVQDIIEFIF